MAMPNFTNSANLGLYNGSSFIANMEAAGQLGIGVKPGAFDAATPFVAPPAIIYVTQVPHMWTIYEDDIALSRALKSMFETYAKSVSGINIGYTMESGQQPMGHDGQQMDAPTVSKRNNVQPNFTFGEITGNLVFRIHEQWIWDMADPDTQISLSRMADDDVLPFTMSTYALSFIALQFDQTYCAERLIGAIYVTNVYPTGTGDFEVKRDIGQASTQDRSISYTGLAIENENIYYLGIRIARTLGLRNGNYLNPHDPYAATMGNVFNNNTPGPTTGGNEDELTRIGIAKDAQVDGQGRKAAGIDYEGKNPTLAEASAQS